MLITKPSQVLIMLSYLVLLCLNIFTVCAQRDDFELEGYYWRDYIGKAPRDALVGGLNSKKQVTYIGQVLHDKLLIPAEINPAENTVVYEWGYTALSATSDIKILCTQYPQRFEWLKTGNGLMQNVEHKNLLIGGFEPDSKIYVGRIKLDDETVIGKIISGPNQTTLNIVIGNNVTQHAGFEILTYNSNIDAINTIPSIGSTTGNCVFKNISIIVYT